MSGRGRPTKSEIILLGLTAVFLCALAGLSLRDRQDRVPGVVIETEAEVPREEIAPDFPPVDLNTATAEELDTLPAWPAGSSRTGRPTAPSGALRRSWR